jgi:hypothetical protein
MASQIAHWVSLAVMDGRSLFGKTHKPANLVAIKKGSHVAVRTLLFDHLFFQDFG